MGYPLAPSECEGNREGGGITRWVTSLNDQAVRLGTKEMEP